MRIVVGAAVLGAVAWAVAPWVELVRRGKDSEPPADSWFNVELPEPRPTRQETSAASVVPLRRYSGESAPDPPLGWRRTVSRGAEVVVVTES